MVDLCRGVFDAFGNPLAAFRLRKVHELHANGSTIVAASVFGHRASQFRQIRLRERTEKAERIEISLVVSPTAERVEDTLALRTVANRGFLARFGCLRGTICF